MRGSEGQDRRPRLHMKYLYLTFLLVGLVVARPALPPAFVSRFFIIVMVVSAWVVSSDHRRSRIILAVLSIPAVGSLVMDVFFPSAANHVYRGLSGTLVIAMTVLLFLHCGAVLLVSLMRKEHVTGDDILGTICLYIMIGFTWAFFYTLQEMSEQGSFAGLNYDVTAPVAEQYSALLSEFVYFSFITLATQGYGDITPQGAVPETIVIVETIIGQLYVALVLAYLLSVHITQRMKEK